MQDRSGMSIRKKCAISITLVVIAVLMVVGAWFSNKVKPPEITEASASAVRSGSVIYDDEAIKTNNLDRKDGFFTVLVVGVDEVSRSTDTIMLATFDTTGKKLSLLSVPRDTITRVSRSNKKINAAYASHGGDIYSLYDEIESVTGIRPDKYAIVRVSGFVNLIDTLGGVEVDVPVNMYYEDPAQNLKINIKKGHQTLDGYDAMGFMRYRKTYVEGDIGRIKVQHTFIKALADKLMRPETIAKIPDIATIILENVETDLTLGNEVWLGKQLVSMNLEADVRTDTLPGYGEYYKGLSYYFVNEKAALELINEHYSPFKKPIERLNLFKK